jgi:hypothetical protein
MQENPDNKTPKPNSKWQQKFTHTPHLPTQGDLSLRKETLGSPACCTDMILSPYFKITKVLYLMEEEDYGF